MTEPLPKGNQLLEIHSAAHYLTCKSVMFALMLAFAFKGLHTLCVCPLMLHCSVAHASLFVVCYLKQKLKLITVCSRVFSKCVIASAFYFQVEACCEHVITYVPKII